MEPLSILICPRLAVNFISLSNFMSVHIRQDQHKKSKQHLYFFCIFLIFNMQAGKLLKWSVKFRSGAQGHGVCWKSMARTITMQDFTLTAAEPRPVANLIVNGA